MKKTSTGKNKAVKNKSKKSRNIIVLIAAIIICQLAGAIGAIFTTPKIATWYASINKPIFNPPNWIFGPVWTTLFLMMGFSLYLIWISKSSKDRTFALCFFGMQLLFNIVWSVLFFGLQNPFLAFIEIIILWLAILLTIIYSYKVSKDASYLMIPYILWVSFAAVLNFAIYFLN